MKTLASITNKIEKTRRLPGEKLTALFERIVEEEQTLLAGEDQDIWDLLQNHVDLGMSVGQWLNSFSSKSALVAALRRPPKPSLSPLEKAAKKMARMLRSVRGGGRFDYDGEIDAVLSEYTKAMRQSRRNAA